MCRTNYEAVTKRGILIRSKIFGECHYHPRAVRTTAEAAEHGPFDYVLVASKAFPETAALIKSAVTPGYTAIVLAQNGIGIEEDYARLYRDNTTISGVVYLPVTQVEAGVIEMADLERFEIGTFPFDAPPKAKQHAQTLADIWTAGGGNIIVHNDVQPTRWVKLSVNASWNPICALTVCDDANYIRSSSTSEDMVRKIMMEVGRIAAAAGYPGAVSEKTIANDLERPRGRLLTGGKEPSMLTDVRDHRPIEVEAILGNALRIARQHGVNDTPYLELLYTLASARNFELVHPETWRPLSFAVMTQNGAA